MITEFLLLAITLAAAPDAVSASDVDGQICAPVPPAPVRIDAARFGDIRVGSPAWGAEATYALSSGDVGEAFVVIESDASGEAYLMINGTIIVHTAITLDPATDQTIVTTWYPPTVDHPPEVIAEMMRVDLPVILAEAIPQEFKCSPFGKKVARVASLLFRATAFAAGGACCAATAPSIAGCAICSAGFGLVQHEVGKVIGEHCD